jgi:hypothetical protein
MPKYLLTLLAAAAAALILAAPAAAASSDFAGAFTAPERVAPGETFHVTLTSTNTGPSDVIDPLRVTLRVPVAVAVAGYSCGAGGAPSDTVAADWRTLTCQYDAGIANGAAGRLDAELTSGTVPIDETIHLLPSLTRESGGIWSALSDGNAANDYPYAIPVPVTRPWSDLWMRAPTAQVAAQSEVEISYSLVNGGPAAGSSGPVTQTGSFSNDVLKPLSATMSGGGACTLAPASWTPTMTVVQCSATGTFAAGEAREVKVRARSGLSGTHAMVMVQTLASPLLDSTPATPLQASTLIQIGDPVGTATGPQETEDAPAELTLPKSKTLTADKHGKVAVPVTCHDDDGCAAHTMKFSGKSGKVKIAGKIKVPALKDGQTVTAKAVLDRKTIKALLKAKVGKVKLTIQSQAGPVKVTVSLKRLR